MNQEEGPPEIVWAAKVEQSFKSTDQTCMEGVFVQDTEDANDSLWPVGIAFHIRGAILSASLVLTPWSTPVLWLFRWKRACLRVEVVPSEVCPVSRPDLPPQPSRGVPPFPSTRPCARDAEKLWWQQQRSGGAQTCLSLHAHSLTRKCLYPPDISPLLPWSMELKQPTTLSSLWTLHSGIREVNLFKWVLWINMCALGVRQKCLKVKNPSTSYKADVSMNRSGRISLASPRRSPFSLGLGAQRILPM